MSAIILGAPLPPERPIQTERLDAIGGLLNASYVGLAREIAQGITPLPDLARIYGFDGMNDPRWESVLAHPEFQRILAESVREWNSADGTAKRVRYKAAAAVEANLPVIHEIVNSGAVPAIQRVEAFKTLSRLAGMGDGAANPSGARGGAGFSVTINIGGGQQVRLAATPEKPVIEGDSDDVNESSVAELVTQAIAG